MTIKKLRVRKPAKLCPEMFTPLVAYLPVEKSLQDFLNLAQPIEFFNGLFDGTAHLLVEALWGSVSVF